MPSRERGSVPHWAGDQDERGRERLKGSGMENQLTMNARTYFSTLNSIPLIHMSILMSVLHCLDYRNIVGCSEIGNFVLFQGCFGYFGSFVFPRDF